MDAQLCECGTGIYGLVNPEQEREKIKTFSNWSDIELDFGKHINLVKMKKKERETKPKKISWEEAKYKVADYWKEIKQVRSYLVREENFDSLREWLKQQNFMGRWMPEGNENYSVFSKEHYWSPAYKDKVIENDELDWQAIKKNQTNYEDDEIIAEVLPTAEVHRWEGTEATSFLAARDLMFKGMNFSFSEIASCWFNENGILACFDPHMFGEDSSQLLVNKELLEEFLKEEGLKIIWTVLGEKQIQSSNLKSNQWLEISGVYELIDGHIKGEINKFIEVVGA